MLTKYHVYAAGAMHGRLGKDVLAERQEARETCNKLGLTMYDAAQDENVHPARIIDNKPDIRRMKWYVEKDHKALDRCKAVVVLTGDRSSSGTAWEMARAYYKLHIPIVVVAPRLYDRTLVNFTTVLATKICATQLQAFKAVKRLLKRRS